MAEQPHHWYSGIQVRDVLYAISLITVGLLFIFQRQSDVRELSSKLVSSVKIQEQLAATLSIQQKLIDTNTSDIRMQAERNLEQDKRISEAQTQLITLVPMVVEIRTKLNFVADLMDHSAKEKR